MPKIHKFLLHNEFVIWPERDDLDAVLSVRDTTSEGVWESGYQGNPKPAGGTIFNRLWWSKPGTRYDATDDRTYIPAIERYITADTAYYDKSTSDYAAFCIADVLPDWRVLIRWMYQEKLDSDEIPGRIEQLIREWNHDEKLKRVLIEEKGSGITALQVIQKNMSPDIAQLVRPYQPGSLSKEARARLITPWCSSGVVLLPHPSAAVPWLAPFENELFKFPGSVNDDQVDAFTMMITLLHKYLSAAQFAQRDKQRQSGRRR